MLKTEHLSVAGELFAESHDAATMLLNMQEAVDLRRIQREVSILSRLSNSTIIRLLEVVETRTHIYLVMELAQVGPKKKEEKPPGS